ncbi:hypothetical protein [Lysobacter gummosus]|uniref:hypothetical protein n=1 Tax=Lysobacter gummosus TaxID=262324 RepID=UPI00362BE2E5
MATRWEDEPAGSIRNRSIARPDRAHARIRRRPAPARGPARQRSMRERGPRQDCLDACIR